MVAGHRRMLLPLIAAAAGANLGALAAVAGPSGRGQSYDEMVEAEERQYREYMRRRYRYHYDAHIRACEDYYHALHLEKLRAERERQQRERVKAHIDAAEAKRQRKQAKRRALVAKEDGRCS